MITLGQSSLLGCLGLLMGCASTSTKQTTPAAVSKGLPLPAGVTLHPDRDIQGVWLAEGFDFRGYDTLYIAPPVFAAIERPNEVDMRAMAMRSCRSNSRSTSETKLFAT